MIKNKTGIIFVLILVLAFLAGTLSYPGYFNRGADFLKSKTGVSFPHFPEKPFKLGLDLQGGTHLVYQADLSGIEGEKRSSAMQGLRDIIERRVNLFGVQEPVVQTERAGDRYRLIVELAGIKDPGQAIKMIGETPFLEFRTQRAGEETEEILSKKEKLEEGEDIETALKDPYFKPTELTGQYLERAEMGFDQTTGKALIHIFFDDKGSEIFARLTEENVGKMLAIYIDGVPISTPVVQDKIEGGQAQITGDFTVQEAKELARNLNAGALPVPIEIVSQQSVGPTLGSDSLEKSLKAGIYGFLAIILFLIIFYRLPGLLASFSLAIYVAVILALFKLIPVTLTLAGIGGFILSIGMAVDANVLIFSRIREELKKEQGFSPALEEGFRRSWPSIRDGNLTTLIVALILFWFGTSFIKGFAFTLSIGILVSMLSAIFITRTFLRMAAKTKITKFKKLWS